MRTSIRRKNARRPLELTTNNNRALRCSTCVEPLESRIAPATFTGAGGILSIDLANANETISLSHDGSSILISLVNGLLTDGGGTGGNVSGFGAANGSITSGGFTAINITDSATGTGVSFLSGNGTYTEPLTITLNNAGSGNITFDGSTLFGANLSATTGSGFIASDVDSGLTLISGASLTLSAGTHDVLLKGAVTVPGTTTVTGNVVELSNPANDFVGALQVSAPVAATIVDVNDLLLGASTFGFSSIDQTVHISAGGNITQSGTLTATGSSGVLSFISSIGSITLTDAGNNIANTVAVGFSVTGTNTVSFTNSTGTRLSDVRMESGALTLIAGGSFQQDLGTTIETDGSVALTFSGGANRDVLFGVSANDIGGAVSVTESGGSDLRDFALRNVADNASLPTGTAFGAAGDIRNLTLIFDHNSIVLPAYNVSGALTLTAGGSITQTAAITASDTNVNILGDHAVLLNIITGNNFGSLNLSAPDSTQDVTVLATNALDLGAITAGRGALSVTALNGEITQSDFLVQAKGAMPATFTVSGVGNEISLDDTANRLTGTLNFVGAGLTNLSVRNGDLQARYDQLIIAPTVNDLTVRFDGTSILLPALTIADLNITAQGIVQMPDTALVVSNNAHFTANGFPLTLANPTNNFNNLEIDNSGRNDVSITDVNALNFNGNSTIGSGRLTVIAGGSITQNGTINQTNTTPVGDVFFTTTTGSITLDQNNQLRGVFSATVTGSNALTVNNNNVALTLGAITTGTGAFSASSGNQPISQDPNSVLALGGPSSFSSSNSTTLLGFLNTFTGPITLNGANVSLLSQGPIALATGNVTGILSLETGGLATDSISQTGPLTGNSTATFKVGAGSILLTAANNFSSVSAYTTGSAVSISDAGALNVGNMVLGAGTLTLTTVGNLGTVANTSIVQTTGTGLITIDTPNANNVTLNGALNSFLGQLNILHSTNATIVNLNDLTFTPASSVAGTFVATSGGQLTLPNTVNVTSFNANAAGITVATNITSAGAVSFTGDVTTVGVRTISGGGAIDFAGDVLVGDDLTITTGAGQAVNFIRGVWTQGDQPLTINGTNVAFNIGTGTPSLAEFQMTSGTLSMPGNGNLRVDENGILSIGLLDTPETVTLANGTGRLTIEGALKIGFGDTNDHLIKTGDGYIELTPTARLWGQGLAGETATPILSSQTALLFGRFANSENLDGTPRDFFAGSDVVTPVYDFTSLTVMAGGIEAPGGTFTGFQPDGDKYTVKSSLGGAAGLVVVEDLEGRLGIVVRNDSGSASSLTITAGGGGDGIIPVGGVMIHSTGSATISANASDFSGTIWTGGTLGSLTGRDLIGSSSTMPLLIGDSGVETGKSNITARNIQLTDIHLGGTLNALKAVSVYNSVSITAHKFGSITTTGEVASIDFLAPGSPDPGVFDARLVNTNLNSEVALSSAKIKGTLSGAWDLNGSVGSVAAGQTTNWTIGTMPGSTNENGGLLTTVKSLNLGVVSNLDLYATGNVGSILTLDVTDANLAALSFGTLKASADAKRAIGGNVTQLVLRALGNTGGAALKTFAVAGNLSSSSFTLLDGDLSSFNVSRSVTTTSITALNVDEHGNLKSLVAGRWTGASIDANSIGTLSITGNLAAGLFGDFSGNVTLRGNVGGNGLGTFDAKGSVDSSTFNILSGNLKTFKVGRELATTSIRLTDPEFGTLTLIQAAEWQTGITIVAETIGTLSAVGAPAVGPDSSLLLGSVTGATVTAYLNSGLVPAINKMSVKGDLVSSRITSEMGIASLVVGRAISASVITADDQMENAPKVGRIQTLTAGQMSGSSVVANTLGIVKVIGASTPEMSSPFLFGDATNTLIVAHGTNSLTKPVGIDQLVVSSDLEANSGVRSPFGIKTLTVTGSINGMTINTTNPEAPEHGVITTLTAGEIYNSTIKAGRIGTLKTTGNVALGLLGNVDTSVIGINSGSGTTGALEASSSFFVTGDFADSILDAPGSIAKFQVNGRVASPSGEAAVFAGYSEDAKIGSFTAGALGQPGNNSETRIVTNHIGSMNLTGHVKRGFSGSVDNTFIDILGNLNDVGLGSFNAKGTVSDSTIRVSNGDVTSVTVQRFASSDLLVGFRFVRDSDIAATSMSPVETWYNGDHRIGSFTTTAPFDVEDEDSASFIDSNVVAAVLGKITINGVSQESRNSTTYGIAFKTSAGTSAQGVVKVNGATVALMPPPTMGEFMYLGLPD